MTMFCWYHQATESFPRIRGRIGSIPLYPLFSKSLVQYDKYCSLIWCKPPCPGTAAEKARTEIKWLSRQRGRRLSILEDAPLPRGKQQARFSCQIGPILSDLVPRTCQAESVKGNGQHSRHRSPILLRLHWLGILLPMSQARNQHRQHCLQATGPTREEPPPMRIFEIPKWWSEQVGDAVEGDPCGRGF